MYQEELKIPRERVPVLVGEKGSTKRKIQFKTKTKLKINSTEGDVVIESEDSLNILKSKDIIKAIGRGFNPDIALKLLDDDFSIEIMEIKDFTGKSKSRQIEQKARLIGTKGKARRLIEKMTNTDICVYGKTVCIIGNYNNVALARRAITCLLQGSKHGNVYKLIEKQKLKE